MTTYQPMHIRKLADPHDKSKCAGVCCVGDPPQKTRVPTSWVQRGLAEGWIALEGERYVHCPGGPADKPERLMHTFINAESVILKCHDGDLRYRVTHQPGKYYTADEALVDSATLDRYGEASRVDWFFDLELEA